MWDVLKDLGSVALETVGLPDHRHCMHNYSGVLHMIVPDGHVVLKCCKCGHMETQHRDHWRGTRHG